MAMAGVEDDVDLAKWMMSQTMIEMKTKKRNS